MVNIDEVFSKAVEDKPFLGNAVSSQVLDASDYHMIAKFFFQGQYINYAVYTYVILSDGLVKEVCTLNEAVYKSINAAELKQNNLI